MHLPRLGHFVLFTIFRLLSAKLRTRPFKCSTITRYSIRFLLLSPSTKSWHFGICMLQLHQDLRSSRAGFDELSKSRQRLRHSIVEPAPIAACQVVRRLNLPVKLNITAQGPKGGPKLEVGTFAHKVELH